MKRTPPTHASHTGNSRRIRAPQPADRESASLKRRIRRFYRFFNAADWAGCFASIDPKLTRNDEVDEAAYSRQLEEFKAAYGSIDLRHIEVSPHLTASPHQSDPRPFAFAYVLWRDAASRVHMFRERWILEEGRWFTRVVGLVPKARDAERTAASYQRPR